MTMSQKERQRCHLVKRVIGGRVASKEAGSMIGISCRPAKDESRKKTPGAKGVIHGNRGTVTQSPQLGSCRKDT